MTEKEKMLAGQLYDANYDKALLAERAHAKDLCFNLNQTRPSDEARQREILKELLGQIPEDRTVYRASLAHRTAVEAECPAAEELRRIARRMLGEDVPQDEVGTEVLPWYRRWIRRKPEELIWRREDRR